MQIPLNQFEQYIDETILARGLSYFKNGHVKEIDEVNPGAYEAVVEGTEDYLVKIKIQDENIVDYFCDCPYDMGPVCKHIVAVFFYLQQDILKLKQKSSNPKKGKQKKTVKRKTVIEQVNDLLEKIPHEEIKMFISEKAENNPPFRNLFLSFFAHYNDEETKEIYKKQIKSILHDAGGRHGFIDWSAVRHVGAAVTELLYTAKKHFENQNYKSGVFICCAVMEQMTDALQYADDSNGDVGENIRWAYEMLDEITSEELPEEIRKSLFEYCLTSCKSRIFEGWDWHLGMLNLAVEIMTNNKEGKKILSLLENIEGSEYEQKEAQNIELLIIKKTKGEKAAEKFLEQNLSNPDFRREAIIKAIEKKNFDRAISLAKEGIKQDEKDKPGLAVEWCDWLLKVAQNQNDNEKIIKYARLLFIDNFRHEQDYYQIMKSKVQPEKWNDFVENMIQDIRTKRRGWDVGIIAGIYIKEEWWNRLLEVVKQNVSLNYIEHYEKYLSKNYADEIAQLYEIEIIEYMKNNTGRNHYQSACRYLRRMIKLGARDRVNKIIEYFRQEYKNRKALLEELNRV